MKLHSFLDYLTLCLSLFFLVFPPIIGQFFMREPKELLWNFPAYNLFLALFAFAIVYIFYMNYPEANYFKDHKKQKYYFLYSILFPLTLSFGFLISFSLFFESLNRFFARFANSNIIFSSPQNYKELIFCFLNFFFSAVYEELIFRLYLPERFIKAIDSENERQKFLVELLVYFLFSLSHVYLGVFAVLNAFVAHHILREVYKKSKTIIPCIISHFAYNLFTLYLVS